MLILPALKVIGVRLKMIIYHIGKLFLVTSFTYYIIMYELSSFQVLDSSETFRRLCMKTMVIYSYACTFQVITIFLVPFCKVTVVWVRLVTPNMEYILSLSLSTDI